MGVEDIRQSAANGQLVVILGAGASMALMPKSKKALSWVGLVKSGLEYGKTRGLINELQLNRYLSALESDDIDDLLGAAEFVGRKLDAPEGGAYARWMRTVFQDWAPESGGMQNALRAMEEQKIPIATLNYDTLVESCTGLGAIDFANTDETLGWARKEREGVLHLHGTYTNPNNCVFGIRDYQAAVSDETRLLIQRSLSTLNRLLFVGCGDTFADPNFSALIAWLRKNIGANVLQHYALVRNDEVTKRLADPGWRGFVEPLGYGEDHADLPGFLLDCFPTRRSPKTSDRKEKAAAGRNAQTIEAYRNFLLRDCGEMTIEGMRADMDTAQRKFDLEKLFVPLEVASFPPPISLSDPDRKEKLEQWREKHAAPIAFAKAFEQNRKIALLALPGGGKTLLLKRLAVAYAKPTRREASTDNLPQLDLLPVMIRCREWKEHIRKPIPTLLANIASITGERNLEGLANALERPLKAGTVLLLVDGLDEIHDDGDRSVFVDNLEKFLLANSKIRLLVTSREAGFDLIAPCLNRFCIKFKIAGLNETAITALCEHWHRLMGGGTPESDAEGKMVARNLIKSDSLRRLAENPLLLTMLLVVKHGSGRMPPDRVTLYGRAVEVLLDTWNIKGHEALNVKEAVPQLACLAFELLRQGKQTATEHEILKILEEARSKLPIVQRYAKDPPHEFLKRVELRSSLMLEGGHTSENGKAVPFYQFRHLTFQEYLAAVAAVEGYTLTTDGPPSPLSALSENLTSEEWKEVIPMAAVLARMQAPPLLDALVAISEVEKQGYLQSPNEAKNVIDFRLPPATNRLIQAMVEEAVFPPETLRKAVQIIALFANGCLGNENNWQALSRGPYGPDLRSAALEIYLANSDGHPPMARNTVAVLEAHADSSKFWTDNGCETLLTRLKDPSIESQARFILSIAGSVVLFQDKSAVLRSPAIYNVLETALFDERQPVREAAVWSWSLLRYFQTYSGTARPIPSDNTLKRLVELFCDQLNVYDATISFAFTSLDGVGRGQCSMTLSPGHEALLREHIASNLKGSPQFYLVGALARVAFILKGVFSDDEIRDFIKRNVLRPDRGEYQDILDALGLASPKRKAASRPRRRSSE